MSSLGKVPSFEPDEEYKKLIESMFEQKKELKKEALKEEEVKSVPRHRIRLPEPPLQSPEEQEVSINLAKEEMENIREAFLEFSERVCDTVIYSYLYGEVDRFIEACEDMEDLIEDNFNRDEMTENGLAHYEKVRKLRARILGDIYKEYNIDK